MGARPGLALRRIANEGGVTPAVPTYEYECRKCGGAFEHSQRMSDEPLKTCVLNGCNGKVIRLVSAGAGVIFKGSGFYETDYKRKSNESETKSETKKEEGSCPASKEKSCPHSESCPAAGKGD